MTVNKIAAYRKSLGLSQRELAKRTGLSPYTIVKAEKNIYNANFSTLVKIAKVLNVSVDNLTEEKIEYAVKQDVIEIR